MAAHFQMHGSTLTVDELQRFSFNGLMDYHRKPQQPADIIASYQPVLIEAERLAAQYKAELAALPHGWVAYSEAESRAMMKKHQEMEHLAFSQERHACKLRTDYSYILAHSIWWQKEDAQRATWRAKMDAWETAENSWHAEQDAFEEAQTAAAMAALPSLPEATAKRLRRMIKSAIANARQNDGYWRMRVDAPRRIKRGIPLVKVGILPRPPLPQPEQPMTIHHHAF